MTDPDSHTCPTMPSDPDLTVGIARVGAAGPGYPGGWLITIAEGFPTVAVRVTFCPWCGVRL